MSELRKQLSDEQLIAIETAKTIAFVFDSLFPTLTPPKNQREVTVEKPLMFSDFEKEVRDV